jgi:hypothetical protein
MVKFGRFYGGHLNDPVAEQVRIINAGLGALGLLGWRCKRRVSAAV